jgi:hypothetical protein
MVNEEMVTRKIKQNSLSRLEATKNFAKSLKMLEQKELSKLEEAISNSHRADSNRAASLEREAAEKEELLGVWGCI